jgi:hypothetical protein
VLNLERQMVGSHVKLPENVKIGIYITNFACGSVRV